MKSFFLHILPEIQASFKDLKQFLRSNEKHIKNVENYLYGTMQNLFGVWWNKQAAREYAAKHPEEEKPDDNDNSGLYY
ncbi:hypothetical protein ACA584_15645 [Lactiplantibacillus plantarum]|uniref:hypothetical protein n=1 Tax=Lactiplantibacillus plantarum TaxID=1590 RepID=UPI003C249AD0